MNRKGFTLVEVIVTILIIAILSGVGVVGFQTFFKTGEDRYYDALESDILLASNDYFTDHRDLLPTSGTYGEVSLSDLIKEKYIEEVKDAKGNVCSKGEVYVYRENNKYVYEPCIECGGYKSKGIKYCNNENSEALKSEITITAVTSVTNTPWDVNVSYNAAKAVNNENVNVYFRSDNYLISSYEIVNTASGDKSSCNLGSESSCFIPISESGTYKVTAYGDKGNGREALVTNKYISVKISRSGPEYSVTGDRKYIINKNECNNNITKKTVELTIVKDNANVEVGKIKYKINNGDEEVVDNGLTISKELESGHYVFEITVEDFSGASLPPTTVAVDVAYLIDIEYDDDHSTATHEVVKGQNYDFLSDLPRTKTAFGKSLDIRWHLNGERIYPENIVENSCTYKIIGKMSIPVQVEDFTKYCLNPTYNGSSQSLTKTPPANVTFKKSDKTSAEGINAGEYNLIAVINTPTYIWQDGDKFDFEDKPFKCSIGKATPVLTMSATSGTVKYNGTLSYTIKSNVSGSFANSSNSNIATVTPNSQTANANNVYTIVLTGKASSGNATITNLFTPNDTKNYQSTSKTYTVSLSKGTNTITITNQTYTYDGKGHGTVASATSGSPSVTYYSNSNCTTKTTTSNATSAGGTPKNAGIYYAKATVAASTNYAAGDSGCKQAVVINKSNGYINISNTNGFTTPGSSISFMVSSHHGGTLTCKSNHTGIAQCSVSGSKVTVKGISAGSTYITVTSAATDNYKEVTSGNFTIIVGCCSNGGVQYGFYCYNSPVNISPKTQKNCTVAGYNWCTTNSTCYQKKYRSSC